MLYCYLSDTALTPLSPDTIVSMNSMMGSFRNAQGDLVRGGVCQVDERVLSIFNVDDETAPGGMPAVYHNIIMDPREARIQALFTGTMADVTGTGYERPEGLMRLHFDQYWAENDSVDGNNIARLADKVYAEQFKKLFNVIETAVMSHVFDSTNKVWIYKTAAEIESVLRTNTTLYGNGSTTEDDITSGYCAGTLTMSIVDYSNDKHATVRNTTASDSKVKTTIGSNPASYKAEILFPNYIQFAFRFGALPAPTWFRIYLNPDTLFANYPKCRITNVVCPASPTDLVNLTYANVEIALGSASRYVANTLTGEVTKTSTDPLLTTNHTGAALFVLNYTIPMSATHYTFTFTCIYKGRQPTISEMRQEIRKILEKAKGGSVESIFPGLYVSTSFIIVPMYNSRVTTDTNMQITYCRGIYATPNFLKNYNGKAHSSMTLSDIPSKILEHASQLVIPAYFMHALVYPENYEAADTVSLDSIPTFEAYQPITTEDAYWGALSDDARDLNVALTKILASQLYNTPLPTDIQCAEETKSLFGEGINRTYITFCVGEYSFSMMTRESFNS